MDDARIGRMLRAIRHRLGRRQGDIAVMARVSQAAISLAERGRIDAMPLRRVRAIARALDAEVVVGIRWRGGDLDRLLDEGHATLLGLGCVLLERLGWETRSEVTFSVFGERGSIDILAWHAATRTLLVIEVKTELTSIEETLRRHDAKVRLAPTVAAERFGWRPVTVARLLVLPSAATPRRRVHRHAPVLDRAYPSRGPAVRRWLERPSGAMSGVAFLSVRARRQWLSRKRIRPASGARRRRPTEAEGAAPTGSRC